MPSDLAPPTYLSSRACLLGLLRCGLERTRRDASSDNHKLFFAIENDERIPIRAAAAVLRPARRRLPAGSRLPAGRRRLPRHPARAAWHDFHVRVRNVALRCGRLRAIDTRSGCASPHSFPLEIYYDARWASLGYLALFIVVFQAVHWVAVRYVRHIVR